MPHKNREISHVFNLACKLLQMKRPKLRIQKNHIWKGEALGGSYTVYNDTVTVVDTNDDGWNYFVVLHELRHAFQVKNCFKLTTGEEEWDADQWALKTYNIIFGKRKFQSHINYQKAIFKHMYRKPKKKLPTKT